MPSRHRCRTVARFGRFRGDLAVSPGGRAGMALLLNYAVRASTHEQPAAIFGQFGRVHDSFPRLRCLVGQALIGDADGVLEYPLARKTRIIPLPPGAMLPKL